MVVPGWKVDVVSVSVVVLKAGGAGLSVGFSLVEVSVSVVGVGPCGMVGTSVVVSSVVSVVSVELDQLGRVVLEVSELV